MVPINLTCPHCLQHFFFEHLFHLYSPDPDDLRNTSVSIDELDIPFSVDKMSKTISFLQRHKSADYNNNVSDFFY